MKAADADILIVPGWLDSGPDHWQSRWERNLKSATRVVQENWQEPNKEEWVSNIIAAVAATTRPAVLVAHSLGAIAVAYAAQQLPPGSVAGAFLVAPPDLDNVDQFQQSGGHASTPGEFGFAPIPMRPLPMPSELLASSDDPYCTLERAKEIAAAWGSKFVDVGPAGHISDRSGHGPWPDGLLRFGKFLGGLKAPGEA